MSTENNVELDDASVLELSDEEVMNMPNPPIAPNTFVDSTEDEEDGDIEESQEATDIDDEVDDDEEFEEEKDSSEDQEQLDDKIFDNTEQSQDNTEKSEEKPLEEESSKDDLNENEIDYKAVHDQIFAPFKANGKEIQVRNVDEVIQLMQMGANYNKKMAGIKQQLPILKMLEKNDLLDQRKLSYAIDLMNGDKAAIAKLVKDTEIDLYDIDEKSGENYEPSFKGVSDQELALSQTIDDLKDSPVYDKTIEVATTIWDSSSQKFIVENPEVLKVLEDHIRTGLFNTIWDEVERLQTLGKLPNLNSLEAYKVVGDYMNEQGLLGNGSPEKKQPAPDQNRTKETKRRKQATQKPKSSGKKNSNNDVINPLSLSDEDFEKMYMEHLM